MLKNLMRDPAVPGGQGGSGAPGGSPGNDGNPNFDPQKFREEIQESNRQMFEQFSGTMQNTMKTLLEANRSNQGSGEEEPPAGASAGGSSDPQLKAQFASEMEALGIDDDAAKAMMSFITKVLAMKVPGFEKNILDKVDRTANSREAQKVANIRVAQQYPDTLVPGSPLRSASNDLYNRLSEAEKQAPNAMANCVREAAAELGISPITKQDINQRQSGNPTGAPAGQGGGDGKPSQVELDFAKAMGVSPEKYQEKMNIIKMGQRR